MSEWKLWTVPGEVMDQAIRRMPDEWSINIELNGSNVRPYVILRDENGDCCMDGDGPNDGETLVDCISRLVVTAERVAGEQQ